MIGVHYMDEVCHCRSYCCRNVLCPSITYNSVQILALVAAHLEQEVR